MDKVFRHLDISDVNYSYSIDVRSKYTFIIGDSGSGKSHLCDLVRRYNDTVNAVKSNYTKIVDATDFRNLLSFEEYDEEYIIFLDEDSRAFNIKGFYNFMTNTAHRFIIVSRAFMVVDNMHDVMRRMNFSVYDVYKITTNGFSNTLENYYDIRGMNSKRNKQLVYTEDSKAGKGFFDKILKDTDVRVESFDSKTRVNRKIEKLLEQCKKFTVVVDLCAFGEYFPRLLMQRDNGEFDVLDILSFEHMLSKAIDDEDFTDMMNNPCKFESISNKGTYEKYYEKHLKRMVPNYSKSELCQWILENLDKIMERNCITYLTTDISHDYLQSIECFD